MADWSSVSETASGHIIQGISLDSLCRRSDIGLRGLRACYQPRSKLNLHEIERLVVVSGIFHELGSMTSDLRPRLTGLPCNVQNIVHL